MISLGQGIEHDIVGMITQLTAGSDVGQKPKCFGHLCYTFGEIFCAAPIGSQTGSNAPASLVGWKN